MNLDHDFFQVSKSIQDQKKSLRQKWNTFFSRILVETCAQMHTQAPVADPENFGGGDYKNFKHKTSKIRMSSPKLRLIFRPKSEIQTFFPPKKKKRSSPKLTLIFRPKSEIQTFFPPKIRWSPKKIKKKVFTEIETASPKSLGLGWWGGMHPPIPP